MRVLHVYHDFGTRGGIEDHLADLTRAQARQPGIEPIVLCANRLPITRQENVGGVRVIRAASFGRYFTPFCPTWPHWLHQLLPDIVHLHLPCPLGEWTVWLAGCSSSRLIVSLHNDYVRPQLALKLHRPIHCAVLRRADAIIVGAPDYARTSPVLADLRARVRIVPYGLDLNHYAPGPTTVKTIDVLSAGRLCYYKGIEVLLEAAPTVAGRIRIVGQGPWRRRLQIRAHSHGLSERVSFEGAVSEVSLIEAMRASRLFVFPSTERSEAFGLAQLKAMACGLPVVSSDLPGVSWLNRHEETGLIVPIRDSRKLAEAINRLLTDEPLREQLARGAWLRAQQFDLASMVRATTQIYASVA
jgi:rhamnosyl/mannosyltransferase